MTNAPFGRRIGAMLYDTLLILALLFLGTIPFIALRGGEPVDSGTASYHLSLALIIYLFFVVFWSHYGRTLGMQSWGLRIEDAHGRPPGIGACSIRFAVATLSFAATSTSCATPPTTPFPDRSGGCSTCSRPCSAPTGAP